jgi:hypothetical protein
MLRVFGHLPKAGQYELAVCLGKASGAYRLRKLVEKQQRGLPNRVKHLNRISASAKRVVNLLGINDANSVAADVSPWSIHPIVPYLVTRLYSVAVERRPATARVGADERMASLILLLSDLVEAAKRSALETGAEYRPGHGGKRRAGPTAEVGLVQAIIEAYAELRRRFPNSGPQLAFDQRLKKFIRLGLKLAVTSAYVVRVDAKGKRRRHRPPEMAVVDPRLPTESRTTDDAIRGAYERYVKTTDQGKSSA